MITFQKIKWKNLLSTGNHWTEVDFQSSPTNLVIGTNGAGKSTILDALTFVLFNKPFRKVNKSQLVNAVNERECQVEIDFSINTKQYKVQRGIKPSIFNITVDGVELHKEADDRAMQKILEQGILKLNYKSFTQIVILGSSSFVPFMQLSSPNRREVIEDLLDIRIFSAMNNLIKDRIREKKNNIKSNIEKNKGNINTLIAESDQYVLDNQEIEKTVVERTEEQSKLIGSGEKLATLNNLKGKISNKVSTLTKEHKFFTDNVSCPTCTQPIEESFRLNRINDVQTKAKELKKGYEDLEETIKKEQNRERHFNKLSKEITKLNHDISQNNTRINLNQKQIRNLESEIQTLTSQLKNRNTEHEKLKEFKGNLDKTTEELSIQKEDIQYHDFAYSLLKDDGVKTKIIKKYLPFINQQVNRFLQKMEFYINFQLDEAFSETIQSPLHEDFTYSSFSEGEKMRIDLALLFTWREVARVKNSVNTNLLIMDEVFDSSLDTFGTDDFLKIIRFIIKDANTFVISHKIDMQDKFENVLKFDKVKGFSQIVT